MCDCCMGASFYDATCFLNQPWRMRRSIILAASETLYNHLSSIYFHIIFLSIYIAENLEMRVKTE